MAAVLERSRVQEDVMAQEEAKQGSVSRLKRFGSVEEIWDALEEYHSFHDGIVRKGPGYGGDLELRISPEHILRANQAIDRAMVRLAAVEPKLHLLLHHYYRRGLCEDAGGWLEAAAKSGLILTKKERFARGAFDYILERAVWVLFALHRGSRRGW
ncbi:MAG: hypothetical protein JW820_18735 [Spirochaetales bacterium]|nr:hypothetical protein [Spirochaetales bacterium]